MGTILASPLPACGFSKNRIFATFQTDSVFASLGTAAVNEMTLSGAVFLGRQIAIKYGNITVNFTVTAPNFSAIGNNLPFGIGNYAHAQAMVAYLQANANLNRDFTITASNVGGAKVIFTAKNIGAQYNFVGAIYTSITLTNTTPGTEASKKKNLGIALDCQVYKDGSWQSVYNERLPYVSTKISLNIGEILHAELSPDYPPTWATTTPWKHTKGLLKYRLVATEGYGDPWALQNTVTFPESHVKFGGTGVRTGLTKTPAQILQGATAVADKFLRHGSSFRVIQSDEPQWLTFLNTRASLSSIFVRVYIDFSDGSNQFISIPIANGLQLNECVTIPVWPTALGLHTVSPTKTIVSYQIRMVSGGNFYSEEVAYALDGKYREHKQYFVYLNSLGGWDSFLAYGKSSYGVAWKNQQIARPLPANYGPNDGDLSDVGSTMRDTFAVASSYYGADQIKFVRDFFNSPYKFRWIDGECHPISIKSKDLPEGGDGQNQYTHLFEYQFAYQNESFE